GASAPPASGPPGASLDSSAPDAWRQWRRERETSIAGPDGWITLAGLHWLEPGEHEVGADETIGVPLPIGRAPARVGRLVVRDGRVRLEVASGVEVRHQGVPVTHVDLVADTEPGGPTIVEVGALRMHVIARGGRLALRVRDREHPARAAFRGIPVWPYDPRWRVRARLEPAPAGEQLTVVSVVGTEEREPVLGSLHFEANGRPQRLVVTGRDPSRVMLMLRDQTSELAESYPAGRYLDLDLSQGGAETTVDFNFLYTPPCAFTPYATCPLPPESNTLDVAIRAGERFVPAHD
ncbi:MAG: DUF1684 domain-containing protein, partial [Myxococcota bacterium]|nr:DUF1684 domain-containing protein [Myxococcota bacterium]